MREKLLAGNWKMFKTADEAASFFNELKKLLGGVMPAGRSAAFGVPFTALPASVAAAKDIPGVAIAAQNLHWEKEGAFTGEISAPMIKAAGAGMVIIGHSERRQYFGDTDEWVNKKLRAALAEGLAPIVCLGETLAERESGRAFEVFAAQLKGGLAGFTAAELKPLILAYEPVWAIGTGKTATPEIAQEVHAFIRAWIGDNIEKNLANSVQILYGGSVKPDNAGALMAQPDIDGALVGGASLDAASFIKIIKY